MNRAEAYALADIAGKSGRFASARVYDYYENFRTLYYVAAADGAGYRWRWYSPAEYWADMQKP